MNQEAFAIDKAALRPLNEIGKGGQGRVWATDSIRINETWSAAYKEYNDEVLADLNVDLLGRMVSFVPKLAPDVGRWLCDRAAWPAALVRDNGEVRGFLMRRIPADFEICLRQRGGQRKPSGMQFLLNSDDYLARMKIAIDDHKRLLLLRALVGTLDRFHSLGIVVGDLSPNNLMFQLSATPQCFFIDCDAMRLNGESVLEQAETAEWEVPASEELATHASDAYKLGLLAIRLFARDQSARDSRALSRVSPQLEQLAMHSQSADPDRRPRPGEWIEALDRATQTMRGFTTNGFVQRVTAAAPSRPPPSLPPSSPAPPILVAPSMSMTVASCTSSARWWKRAIPAIMVCAVLLCLVGLFGLFATVASTDEVDADATGPGTTGPAVSGASTTAPAVKSATGIVAYDQVSEQSDGPPVAEMFAAYFNAVNARDWDAALSFYDPGGVVDPGEPAQRETFEQAMSTTTDRDAELLSVLPSGPETLALLTFISIQDAGFGPARDRHETCTRWRITYRLTYSDQFGYRILRADNAADRPC